jgi:hypothetical protein
MQRHLLIQGGDIIFLQERMEEVEDAITFPQERIQRCLLLIMVGVDRVI